MHAPTNHLGALALLLTVAVAGCSEDNSPRQSGIAPTRGQPSAHAVWVDRARTLQGMRAKSDLVVLATVTAVDAGPDLPDDNKHDDSQAMPSQFVTLEVSDVLKATDHRPRSVVIAKTGDDDTWIEEDPPYRLGDTYILGLVHRPDIDGAYRPLGPDARLLVEGTTVATWTNGDMREQLAEFHVDSARDTVVDQLRSG